MTLIIGHDYNFYMRAFISMILLIWAALNVGAPLLEADMNKEIRQPAVAGSFYPGEPSRLAKMIAEMLAKTEKPSIPGDIIGLIAPHAGYIYSGPVAAYAYKAIQGMEYSDVIVIAPCHVEAFAGAAVYPGDAYATPLGDVEINKELSRKITSYSKLVKLSEQGHQFSYRGGEHSLEVQLPFLQTMLEDFRLVAVVMGGQDMQTCKGLAESITKACQDRNDILIVATTDLSHYHDYGTAVELDSRVVELVNSYDYNQLFEELRQQKVEACGGGPMVALMMAAEKLGAGDVEVVKYANSGDVTGDKSAVVGYLSAVIYKTDKSSKTQTTDEKAQGADLEKEGGSVEVNPASAVDFGLSDNDKETLLKLAREVILATLEKRQTELDKSGFTGVLAENRGAFVTLTIGGNLRGCIGYTQAVKPLYETIAEMAVQAAFHDPRFPPLTSDELRRVEVEISVLTPMTVVTDPNEVVVGRDGLYITRGFNSGLLLPQVAVDYNWDRETFLDQTCLKAGLPPGIWKKEDTRIYRFQADIFKEE